MRLLLLLLLTSTCVWNLILVSDINLAWHVVWLVCQSRRKECGCHLQFLSLKKLGHPLVLSAKLSIVGLLQNNSNVSVTPFLCKTYVSAILLGRNPCLLVWCRYTTSIYLHFFQKINFVSGYITITVYIYIYIYMCVCVIIYTYM